LGFPQKNIVGDEVNSGQTRSKEKPEEAMFNDKRHSCMYSVKKKKKKELGMINIQEIN